MGPHGGISRILSGYFRESKQNSFNKRGIAHINYSSISLYFHVVQIHAILLTNRDELLEVAKR